MAKKRVMIVDDDADFLQELGETLSMSGYDMVAVNDSGEALEIAGRTKPDIILLDLKMPVKSGFQLADEINQRYKSDNIPIIAMSAFVKDEYAALLKVCGIKKYIKKPFYPLNVITLIEETLNE